MKIVTNTRKLRKPTEPVTDEEDISEIVANLFQELKDQDAYGLSANQLGYDKKICVIRLRAPVCLVNPEITKERSSQVGKESCLSLPKTRQAPVVVKRPHQVVVKGLNQYGKFVKYRLSGLEARIVCHEVDHLNGKLITDYSQIV